LDNALDEDKQYEKGYRLMGYDLLFVALALAMKAWKYFSSSPNLVAISPKAEVFLWSLLGVV
jgi:hypothetical protein